jgi:hypothetical protein
VVSNRIKCFGCVGGVGDLVEGELRDQHQGGAAEACEGVQLRIEFLQFCDFSFCMAKSFEP